MSEPPRFKPAKSYSNFSRHLRHSIPSVMTAKDGGAVLCDFGLMSQVGNKEQKTDTEYTENKTDPTLMEKYYVFERGLLLLDLMMKKVHSWDDMGDPGLYTERRGSSVVDETLVDAKTASKITQLIESCVRCEPAERLQIDCVFDNLSRIAGY